MTERLNGGKSGSRVYAAAIGKSYFAFYVAGGGVHIYNMDAATLLASPPCVENAPDPASACPSVYLGRGLTGTYIHPTTQVETEKSVGRIAGVDSYVITGSLPGVDIWSVSDPAKPVRLGGGLDKASVQGGVAMWRTGNAYYAAALVFNSFMDPSIPFTLDIYDITPIVSSAKSTLDPPIFSMPAPTKALDLSEFTNLQFSRTGGGADLLYFTDGASPTHDLSSVGDRHEQLFDISNPLAPRDITPPAQTVAGTITDYWGHSYQYGWVRPSGGVLVGNHFYRAAQGMLDIHTWGPPVVAQNLPPVITSSPPTSITALEQYEYNIEAYDPEGAALTFNFIDFPQGMVVAPWGWMKWLTDDGDTYMPAFVSVDVSDGTNTVSHAFSIEVLPSGRLDFHEDACSLCSAPGGVRGATSAALIGAVLLGLAFSRRRTRACRAPCRAKPPLVGGGVGAQRGLSARSPHQWEG